MSPTSTDPSLNHPTLPGVEGRLVSSATRATKIKRLLWASCEAHSIPPILSYL